MTSDQPTHLTGPEDQMSALVVLRGVVRVNGSEEISSAGPLRSREDSPGPCQSRAGTQPRCRLKPSRGCSPPPFMRVRVARPGADAMRTLLTLASGGLSLAIVCVAIGIPRFVNAA